MAGLFLFQGGMCYNHGMKPQATKERTTEKSAASAASGNGAAAKEPHQLASVVGSFADDPTWDEFLLAMEESRRQLDAAGVICAGMNSRH